MAQHDMVLDNNPGLAFRQDLNNALAALVSTSLGNTAPTTTYAGQEWIDTGTSIDTDGPWLRQRNSTNTAWTRVRKVDTDQILLKVQQDQIAVTTAGASPSFTISTKLTNSVAVAANQRFRVKFHAAGTTGSNTLARDGLTPYSLKQYDATGAKVAAIITSGLLTDVEYDGTDYVVLNPVASFAGVSQPVSIASAGTLNLSSYTGKTVHITGTTNISAITLVVGQQIDVIFDGILTLSYNSSTNNLPGGVDITTAVGDKARYYYDGTTVYCQYYIRSAKGPILSGPNVAVNLSGTSVTFTGIPPWAKRVNIILWAFNANVGGYGLVRIGSSSGGIEATGYSSGTSYQGGASGGTTSTVGFVFGDNGPSDVFSGSLILQKLHFDSWNITGTGCSLGGGANGWSAGGIKSLTVGTPLDRIQITSVSGTATLSGACNITWE